MREISRSSKSAATPRLLHAAACSWPDLLHTMTPRAGPRQITVELDDGEDQIELIGHVGWMEPITLPGNPAWSNNRTGNVIRPATAADDTATLPQGEPGSGPYLLLELPTDGSGDLLVGRQRIPLYWTELPPDLPFQQPGRDVTPAGTMVMENAPNRPHADNAFSWWRWTLLANRLNMNPPPAPNASTVQRLLAHHIAQVWRIGLDHRLATTEPRHRITVP